jgi:3-hydroxy acid dehydrogenase / malonic semialdehyde reductase
MSTKIALVTGATAGIGEATAIKLAAEGWKLILTGRREERLIDLASRLGVPTMLLSIDMRNRVAVEAALDKLPDDWKNIDLLINNAGLSQGLEPIHNGNPDDWDTMLDTNVKGLLYISRIVSRWMIDREIKGQIIHVSSTAGKEVYVNGNVYCASKHAVEALAKGMRLELNPYGIRVGTVSPGMVETEFSIVRFKGDTARAAKVYEGFEPLRAEDVAEGIMFMVNRPPHVNISDLLIMPTAQAASMVVKRS